MNTPDTSSNSTHTFKDYKAEAPSWFTRKLWWMSGADERLMSHATYADHVKYQCMGGIVLSTGVMAAFAGGYAFYTIFKPKGYAINNSMPTGTADLDGTDPWTALMAIGFGIIWGLIILNIDRFIVAGAGKGDGTEAITGQELKSAIPRILMGMIIAITVSKPIEIRMFKSEIDQALYKKQREIAYAYRDGVKKKYEVHFTEVQKKLDAANNAIENENERYVQLQNLYNNEMGGKMSGKAGEGPIAKKYREQMVAQQVLADQTKTRLEPDLKRLNQEYEQLTKDKNAEENDTEKVAASLDGLLERLKLSHEIAGNTISLFITLLFMALELTPIFFKMMLIRSPYDYLEDGLKEHIKVRNGILPVATFKDELQGQEEIKYRHYESFLKEMEQVRALNAQRQLMDHIAAAWVQRMKRESDEQARVVAQSEAANRKATEALPAVIQPQNSNGDES